MAAGPSDRRYCSRVRVLANLAPQASRATFDCPPPARFPRFSNGHLDIFHPDSTLCVRSEPPRPRWRVAVNDEVKTKRHRTHLGELLPRRALSRLHARAVAAVCQPPLSVLAWAKLREPSEPHPVPGTWFTQPRSCLRLPRLSPGAYPEGGTREGWLPSRRHTLPWRLPRLPGPLKRLSTRTGHSVGIDPSTRRS